MVENIIFLLIYICLLVGLVYLIIWVSERLGIPIPLMVMNTLWIIVVLIVILLIWRAISPFLGRGLFPH